MDVARHNPYISNTHSHSQALLKHRYSFGRNKKGLLLSAQLLIYTRITKSRMRPKLVP